MAITSYIRLNRDDVHFVLVQEAQLYFDCASSLKQQSVGRHVTPLRHICLLSSQPVFGVKQYIPIVQYSLPDWSLNPLSYQTQCEYVSYYSRYIQTAPTILNILFLTASNAFVIQISFCSEFVITLYKNPVCAIFLIYPSTNTSEIQIRLKLVIGYGAVMVMMVWQLD